MESVILRPILFNTRPAVKSFFSLAAPQFLGRRRRYCAPRSPAECQTSGESARGADRLGGVRGKGDSGEPLIAKMIPDSPVEVGPFGFGGDQALENRGGNGEIAIHGATAELQLKGLVGRVGDRSEQRRLQGSAEQLLVHGDISVAG